MPDLGKLACLVLDTLDEIGVPNALCGGLAHNAWVEPEGQFLTKDVDVAVLVADISQFDVENMVSAVRRRSGNPWFFRDRYRRIDRMIYKFQLGENEGAEHFDLVLANPEYAAKAIENAGVVVVGGSSRKVLQPEDVILFKSLGRRNKDKEKIAKLHELIELDLDYIEAWARHLGRWDYVQEALSWAEDETRDLLEDEG